MRVGLVSLRALRGAKRENLERIIGFGEEAAAQGCALAAFPEFSVTGPYVAYDPEATLDALLEDAEPIPGPSTDRLAEVARKLDMAFCVGLAERGLSHKPFNTQVVVGPGGVIHRQRKMEPTLSERDFFRGGGDHVAPFTLHGHTFGVTICADNRFHAAHNHLYAQGARCFLAPHAGAIKKYEEPGDSWASLLDFHRRNRLLFHRALARRLSVTTFYLDLKDPRDAFDERPEWPHYVSGKCAAFGPDGACLAENAGNEESLLVIPL